jgi:hypothetical protein
MKKNSNQRQPEISRIKKANEDAAKAKRKQEPLQHQHGTQTTNHFSNKTMKIAPPILIASTAAAFAPSRTAPQQFRLYQQPDVKDAPIEVNRAVNGKSSDAFSSEAINIGEMPRSLDENTMKKQVAKVLDLDVLNVCFDTSSCR